MEGPPDLAVEVISPSSVEVDRQDKFAQYREAGVAHYWVIDPALKTIETWKLEGGQYVAVGRGQGAVTVSVAPFPDLQIPLGKLWRE
jgi:Uma2 family endonuclease